jgi:hypothetical protein
MAKSRAICEFLPELRKGAGPFRQKTGCRSKARAAWRRSADIISCNGRAVYFADEVCYILAFLGTAGRRTGFSTRAHLACSRSQSSPRATLLVGGVPSPATPHLFSFVAALVSWRTIFLAIPGNLSWGRPPKATAPLVTGYRPGIVV